MRNHAERKLLGGDFAAVCARFGAPLGCDIRGGVLRLTYLGRDGNAVEGAIEFIDGVVTRVLPGIRRSPQSCCGHQMIGWPVERLLPELGEPFETVSLGESTRLLFEKCEVTVYEGEVACVVPRAPTATAPTPRASA